jgi:hypothetical protein
MEAAGIEPACDPDARAKATAETYEVGGASGRVVWRAATALWPLRQSSTLTMSTTQNYARAVCPSAALCSTGSQRLRGPCSSTGRPQHRPTGPPARVRAVMGAGSRPVYRFGMSPQTTAVYGASCSWTLIENCPVA